MNQLDLETAKSWLAKRAKMSEKAKEKDSEFNEMVRLIDRVWDQWQIDFSNMTEPLLHPFIRDLFVAKELYKYPKEAIEAIRENVLKRGRIGE